MRCSKPTLAGARTLVSLNKATPCGREAAVKALCLSQLAGKQSAIRRFQAVKL